jgi:hypothetical protein
MRKGGGELGTTSAGVGDINNDGFSDLAIGSLTSNGVIVFGASTWDTVYNLGSATVIDAKISSLKYLGDYNNDGIDDVLISQSDTTYIMFGHKFFNSIWHRNVTREDILATSYEGFDGTKGITIDTDDATTVGVAGDVDGDSKVDLIMGDLNLYDYAVLSRGFSRLFYGFYNSP